MKVGILATLLFLTWFLWSGHTSALMLFFGLVSCAGVVCLDLRLERHANLKQDYRLGMRWLKYAPWLILQIIKSNLDVAKLILHPELPVSPKLIRVKGTQESELGQVIYANSITLTPGTVTLDVRDDNFLVHALTEHSAAGVQDGEMNDRVTAMEKGGCS